MAYFSNGTEAEIWQSENCFTCQHWKERDEIMDCPIYALHFQWNYDQIEDKDKESILDSFIPREGVFNGKCEMHAPVNMVPDRSYTPAPPQAYRLLEKAKWSFEQLATALKELADDEWEKIAAAYDEETGSVSIELAMTHMDIDSEAKRIGEFLERHAQAEPR